MSDFYRPFADAGDVSDPPPKILGLSASPVKKAAATRDALEQIERNLQATARTPKVHRSELMRFVHKPELKQIDYPVSAPGKVSSPLLRALKVLHTSYNIKTDPYLLDLLRKQQNGYDVSKPLEKLLLGGKTYCSEQLRILALKASDMADELGVSAMEWYLYQCVTQFQQTVDTASDQQLFDSTVQEKQHLMSLLESLPLSMKMSRPSSLLSKLSRKVDMLVEILVSESKAKSQFTGLIFVEQRIWVGTLAQILATHPGTQDLIRIGTFVGTSASSKRKTDIANCVEPRNQQATLEDFRAGRTNLIITTSVLEEGIDISSCNLVICFERPKSLKSFVQRRGRARKEKSKYLIFNPEGSGSRSSESWQSLEAEMRKAYEDDMRLVEEANERENQEEKVDGREFRVPDTG
ncbi:hypothetical protein NX059_008338 [Plenodomus lindquistii]|nr:hypothetical protein NX059_008338 [Plenodomus lindquistii]